MILKKIKNHPNLVKNMDSGVINNSDYSGGEMFLRSRKMIERRNDKIEDLEKELNDMKKILYKLVNKGA